MTTWKRSRITLSVPEWVSADGKQEVSAYLSASVPGLAIHRPGSTPSLWTITHAPSGKGITQGHYYPTLRKAVDVAEQLGKVMTWDGSEVSLVSQASRLDRDTLKEIIKV